MTVVAMLGLAAVLAVGSITIHALAETDTPHKQLQNGTPLQDIQCRDSKILMETARGTPVCVNWSSVERLEKKSGFAIANPLQIQREESTVLRRGPIDIPILQKNFSNPHEIMTQTLKELQTAKQTSQLSARHTTSDEFVVTDWVPDYVPTGYKLGYSVHGWHTSANSTKHGLIMHFVPVSFVYTNSTTENDVRNTGGIIYYVSPHDSTATSHLTYDEMRSLLYRLPGNYSEQTISDTVVNQTNGYFGMKKPDNEYLGFHTKLHFETYYVDLGYKSEALPYDEGIKIANSIQGVIIPE